MFFYESDHSVVSDNNSPTTLYFEVPVSNFVFRSDKESLVSAEEVEDIARSIGSLSTGADSIMLVIDRNGSGAELVGESTVPVLSMEEADKVITDALGDLEGHRSAA